MFFNSLLQYIEGILKYSHVRTNYFEHLVGCVEHVQLSAFYLFSVYLCELGDRTEQWLLASDRYTEEAG